jgi:hypothetical protein
MLKKIIYGKKLTSEIMWIKGNYVSAKCSEIKLSMCDE